VKLANCAFTGPGVAAGGYLRRPEMTAEKFLSNPWGKCGGLNSSILYRSGDLARINQDGFVQLHGTH